MLCYAMLHQIIVQYTLDANTNRRPATNANASANTTNTTITTTTTTTNNNNNRPLQRAGGVPVGRRALDGAQGEPLV